MYCREQKLAVTALTNLRVWHEETMAGGLQGWKMNQIFRKNMKVALLGG